ncbi:MAG TPA: hypothetical protein VGL14_10335 [Methylomirabilota bacterium]
MRRLALALLAWLALVGSATAAEWGAIQPGTSTMDSVRAQYGGPTRTETEKVEGYDTTTWIYEGTRAPTGLTRMVVDFGLLQAGGFQRAVVRALRLEPHRGVFTRDAVLAGWGRPTGVSKEGGSDSFFYEDGLLVIFDKDAWYAVSMLFTLPQPSGQAKPSR